MKKQIILIVVSCVVLIGLIYYNLNQPFGTPIRLTFELIDDLGQPVPDANIRGYLNDPRKHNDAGKHYNVITELDGTCKIRGMGYSFTECTIEKEGYYSSRYHLKLKENDKFVSKLTMVLKKIRNPIAMKARKIEITLPKLGEYFPYDLDVADLVEPYGTGKKAHIYIYYYGENKDFFTGKSIFRLKVLNQNSGLKLFLFDGFSQFRTEYLALANNYTNLLEFVSESTKEKQVVDTKIKKNEYIVFKCQSSTNSAMYNYGKILPDLFYWIEQGQPKVKFTYYYNPTPDDRNLEFAPQKNLIRTVNRRGRDNSDRFDP